MHIKNDFTHEEKRAAFWAGLFYVVVIVTGISAEFLIRQPLFGAGDAGSIAAALREHSGLHRLGLMADLVMVLSDVALGLLLFMLFRRSFPALALTAMVFRLVQAVLISVALLLSHAAGLIALENGDPTTVGLLTGLHGDTYDLGLVFFGVNSLIVARLLWGVGAIRVLALLIGASGLVYLTGSGLRFVAPGYYASFEPAYLVAIVAETWLAGWLILYGWSPRSLSAS